MGSRKHKVDHKRLKEDIGLSSQVDPWGVVPAGTAQRRYAPSNIAYYLHIYLE